MQEQRIETARLTLRAPQALDAAEVQRLAGDFRIADVTGSIPHPYPPELAQQWIERCVQGWASGAAANFVIIESDSGQLIGSMSLENIARGEAEVGYWIGVPYWSRGYASEACNALVDFAFRQLRLRRLHASHLARNPQSGRVLFKAGFRHLGLGHSASGEPMELYERVSGE
ncbi:GNAT family N-acetyltransferase [Pseudomonas sp. GOM7]|uniref:GNAT family N-acetyltransferase n=1 Tax=Pseudomonas sp. GOM7 TaxID=2998079 RepID=UPI00227D55D0|nr:GNAT family N-acetyltransferase [Pseudomonas sp. GOM7]WAJ36347.1 GNAT family N-acetyltransferase [Pseudomonas sp. GOM7]